MKQFTQQPSKVKLNLKQITLFALLGVVLFVAQVILALIGNVELVTVLIIAYTVVFGLRALIPTYIFAFLEIVVYGFGVWNVMYLYVWAILVVLIYLLKTFENKIFFATIAAFYGLFFGTLCSIPYFVVGGASMGIPWIINGIPYDIIHCVSNFVLVYVAYNPIKNTLKKITKPAV